MLEEVGRGCMREEEGQGGRVGILGKLYKVEGSSDEEKEGEVEEGEEEGEGRLVNDGALFALFMYVSSMHTISCHREVCWTCVKFTRSSQITSVSHPSPP